MSEGLRVVLRVSAAGAEHTADVVADPAAASGELVDALAARYGGGTRARLARTGAAIDRAAPIGTLALRDADRLLLGDGPAPAPGGARPAATLVCVGGPDAGRSWPLRVGRNFAGRDPGAAVTLADRAASWQQLELTAGADGTVIATDLGSTNPTTWAGLPLPQDTTWLPGDVMAVGRTLLTVAGPAVPPAEEYRGGRVIVHRPPRRRPVPPRTRFDLPEPPAAPTSGRLPLAAILLPLLIAPVLFLVLRSPLMLLFLLVTPALALAPYLDGRRGGKRDHKRASREHAEAVAALTDELAAAHPAVLAARQAAAPGAGDARRRLVGRTPDLWDRHPGDDDFLRFRLGHADLPSWLELDGADAAEPGTPAAELADFYAEDRDAPVSLDLIGGPLGVAGPDAATDGAVRSLLLQAAALHSPRDLGILVLAPESAEDGWAWTAWLPHLDTLASAPGSRTLARDAAGHAALLAQLGELLEARRPRPGAGDRAAHPTVLVVVLADGLGHDPVVVRAMTEGGAAGVHVVVRAAHRDRLPAACRTVLDLGDEAASFTVGGRTVVPDLTPDAVAADVALELALRAAPLRDVVAGAEARRVPERATLAEAWRLAEPPDAAAVAALWRSGPRPAPIGVAADGPFAVDLRRDGPHALVAGTTGAGKSELLQTLVASLALAHPPDRLTFLLVDYKGGAAFKDCVELPHVTGLVTDLDESLAARALESLRAELRRREEWLRAAGHKDLETAEAAGPDAPPALVIVVDEFAALKQELPRFVQGVVDIARLGRSLGVHLVLATQRPAGVVDDQIRANTSLRIALRVTDPAESVDLVGTPAAAAISRHRPGRAIVRTGPGEVRELQTGYVGGTAAPGRAARVTVRDAPLPLVPGGPATAGGRGPTDLERLVAAAGAAATAAGIAAPSPPWLPALPGRLTLADLPAGPGAAGLLDDPARQRQLAWRPDLARDGHLLVLGAPGKGKTTALRAVAVALAAAQPADRLHLYGIDAGSGLRGLTRLPHCGGVVPCADAERVDRLLELLTATVTGRQAAGGSGDPAPRIVLLLDGWASFTETYEVLDAGLQRQRLLRLLSDGPGVGVHVVLSAIRRLGLPPAVTGAVGQQVVLRLADADEYAALGLRDRAAAASAIPGRAGVDGREAQLADVGEADVERVAAVTAVPAAGGPAPVALLPGTVPLAGLAAPADGLAGVPLGLGGDLRPLALDLRADPWFLVAGPYRSGRTTALRTLAAGVRAAEPGRRAVLLAPRASALSGAGWDDEGVGAGAEAAAERLAAALRAPGAEPVLLVVDDGDELLEGRVGTVLAAVLQAARHADVVVLAAAQTHTLHRTFTGWLPELRKARHGLLLAPDVAVDGELLAAKLPRRSFATFPPGRGLLVRRGDVLTVQVAS